MRVLVFGSKATVWRLTGSLRKEGIESVSLSDTSEAASLLEREEFDLAIVDSLLEEAEAICRRIAELVSIPVVLIVDRQRADWGRLHSMNIHGYIPKGRSGAETAARLRAVARRGLLNGVAKNR